MDKAFLRTLVEGCITEHKLLDHAWQGEECNNSSCNSQLTERIVDKLNMILNP